MTFSVVAISPDEKYIGVAVATKLTHVGSKIPFGSGTGGVIVLQGLLTPEYTAKGKRAIRKLESGKDVVTVRDYILHNDPLAGRRQFQILDIHGNQLSYTGRQTTYSEQRFPTYSGHLYGSNVSVAGNILSSPDVVGNMLDWYKWMSLEDLTFPDLLTGTLLVAEKAGGDARDFSEGYSAALRIYRIGRKEPVLSLDLDDSETPIHDLRHDLEKLSMCK